MNAEGRTALHVALEYNNTTRDALIELGVMVDVCAAASLERMDRLQELLDADPELANDTSTGLPPLGWASYFCALVSARLLLDRGARTGTALMCAAEVACVRVGRLLVERGAAPDELQESRGECAIHSAAAMPHTQDSRPFVEMLLESGADVNVRDADGRTAVAIARRKRDEQRAAPRLHPKPFDGLLEFLERHGGKE